MNVIEYLLLFFQSVLLIVQFFGAFGSVYYLVYVVLFFIDDNQSESINYTDKDLIILFFLFMICLITSVIGILGTLRKSLFCLCLYQTFTVLETVIFFTSGLLLCGVWTSIALIFSMIMIGILLASNRPKPTNSMAPKPTIAAQNMVQNYSYLDNNPPDYNSIDFQKPVTPPEYQSVELMPVHQLNCNNLQKY